MKNKLIVIYSILIVFFSIFLLPNNPKKTYAINMENCKSSILIERKSQKILFNNNSHQKLPIASVTKLMTVLISLENIEENNLPLDTTITVSKNANSMGGSQIFLDADQDYLLGELLKSVIVASANDSSVALAEYFAGSEANFVKIMNNRASELNMNDTHYANCTGLPNSNAYSSAYDQAILLNKVLDFPVYHLYSRIWNEDFVHPSGRTTQMTNTNKLSKYYTGCIGGKTGSTSEAKYCLAVGAKRGDLELISVVLGADDSKSRFNLSTELLDYGFENFVTTKVLSQNDLKDKIVTIKGTNQRVELSLEQEYSMVTEKTKQSDFSLNFNLPNQLISANKGETIGSVDIIVDGVVVKSINILSSNNYSEASVLDYIKEITN